MKIKLPDSWQYHAIDLLYDDSHPMVITETIYFMMTADGDAFAMFANDDPGFLDICWPAGDIFYFVANGTAPDTDWFLLYNPNDESEQWVECHLDQLKTFADNKQLFAAILAHGGA